MRPAPRLGFGTRPRRSATELGVGGGLDQPKPPPGRSPSAGAARARASRARRRRGIRMLRVPVHVRKFAAALRLAGRADDELSTAAADVLSDFQTRWLTPKI